MVEVARRRGAELGLQNVEYRVIDAERIELDADSVDGVLCQSGYMLMADPAAALSETRRVLRPGGRLVLSVWGAPEHNPWASIGGRILVERGHMPPPEPGAPGIFSMASEERTRGLLEGAGFTAVRTEEIPVALRLPGPRRVREMGNGGGRPIRDGGPRVARAGARGAQDATRSGVRPFRG
jgi:SAM-dependent methyltransferase